MKKFRNLKLDIPSIIIPLIAVVIMCAILVVNPDSFSLAINTINNLIGKDMMVIYYILNFLFFIIAIYMGVSRYGDIKLGDKNDKPMLSSFAWGSMMFCSGIAGDLIYFSCTDWIAFSQDPHIISLGNPYDYAVIHASFLWTVFWLYLVVAVPLAFSIHVRKRKNYRFGEALRPIFGDKVDGILGNIINILVVFMLIISVACTECFSIPVLTSSVSSLFNIPFSKYITVGFMILICIIYSISVMNGLKGIEFLSKICVYVFFALLFYILIFGGATREIISSSFRQVGLIIQKFVFLFTDVDPSRVDNYTQNYIAFFIAYWIEWAITVPFFIAIISKGRKIKDVVKGGFLYGIPGGMLGFLVIPNFAISKQIKGDFDFVSLYNNIDDKFEVVSSTFNQLPFKGFVTILVILSMICFTATSLDSLSLSGSYFSYKNITNEDMPKRRIRLMWAIILMLLPIFLTLSETNYLIIQDLVTLFGVVASILIILLIISFFKDANKYLEKRGK